MKKYIYTLLKKCFAISFFIFLLLQFSCKTNSETSTNRKLITADTSAIDGWELAPGKNADLSAYRVMRKNGKWMVSVQGDPAADTDSAFIRRSLQHIINFKSSNKIETIPEIWDSLGVTDKDSRLIIYRDGKKSDEIYLGNIFFNDENKASYYVRVKGENDVYSVENYLEGSIKVPADKIRKKELVGVAPQDIAAIMFLKPGGIDYALNRAGQNSWTINGNLTNDSISEGYLEILSQIAITDFAKAPATGADRSIQIMRQNGSEISLRAYRKNSETWTISSSENHNNFVEIPNITFERIFPEADFFMQNNKK